MLHESSVYANQAKILIWSESAVSLGSEVELNKLLIDAKNITEHQHTWGLHASRPARNSRWAHTFALANVAIPVANLKSTYNITLSAAICLDVTFVSGIRSKSSRFAGANMVSSFEALDLI
ncbi:hypothetical protein BC938DRAFT_471855 [Jimgerdemannia flammicorona]|uniref:Uncharacterized protein n=1 Tax=Jimgerdemannia flammicorona TaxID=994334 RepID=A0A433Q784_9FUNG|nr:hypothetical protein BC938DRAFT_471855 [Jimgerdemannia flammicorona]